MFILIMLHFEIIYIIFFDKIFVEQIYHQNGNEVQVHEIRNSSMKIFHLSVKNLIKAPHFIWIENYCTNTDFIFRLFIYCNNVMVLMFQRKHFIFFFDHIDLKAVWHNRAVFICYSVNIDIHLASCNQMSAKPNCTLLLSIIPEDKCSQIPFACVGLIWRSLVG